MPSAPTLSSTMMHQLRSDMEATLRAALAAADPRGAVLRAFETLDLSGLRDGSVVLLAAGKAATGMAEAAAERLGARLRQGLATTVEGSEQRIPGVEVRVAGHPDPDARSAEAAQKALALAAGAGAQDTVLVLLSGGGSALWGYPPGNVPLADLRTSTRLLLRAGAPIEALNVVRRHLSRIGGGRLVRAARPARVITLAISDVAGDDPAAIASGPTVAEPASYRDALRVLERYRAGVPESVRRHLERGAAGDPSPPPGDDGDARADYHVIARNRDALSAAAEEARRRGYDPLVLTDRMQGEAREVGRLLAGVARGCRDGGLPLSPPAALVLGGETTVTVRGDGRGGRNQELALAAALELDGADGVCLASIGTDGIDGPTPAAGAIVDGGTAGRAREAGLDPWERLARHDSHPLLQAAGDLWVTGPTGTNVNDVAVLLVAGSETAEHSPLPVPPHEFGQAPE